MEFILDKIKFKRGLKAHAPILEPGEPYICTDTGEMFVGSMNGNKLIIGYVPASGDKVTATSNNGFISVNGVQLKVYDETEVINALVNKANLADFTTLAAEIDEARGNYSNLLNKLNSIISGAEAAGDKVTTNNTNGFISVNGNSLKVYDDSGVISALANKVNSSDFTTLSNIVAAKANQTDLAAILTELTNARGQYSTLSERLNNMVVTPPADTTAPVLSITAGGTFTGSKTVTMSATDANSVTIYYTLNGQEPTTGSAVYSNPLSLSATTTLKAFARDAAGNTSAIQTIVYTLETAPGDTTPPANITDITFTNVTQTGVTLSWVAVGDAVSYDILKDGSLVTNIAGTTYNATGLTAQTQYNFTIKPKDAANNTASGYSEQITTAAIAAIPVTGVTLNKNISTLEEGQTTQLIETIAPSNATNKTVVWSSNNEAVATVDNTGLVTTHADGSAVITATTQDGGFTATCTFSITQTIVGFDYNNLSAYGDSSVVAFDQTVNGTSDFVHPSVLYFENGWNGHNYWMGVNPYPETQGEWENPFFFYSDDGDNWYTPAGMSQPIYPKESDVGNNSDSHIFMDYDGVTMHYLNRGALAAGGSMTEIFSTTDGVTWTPRQRLFTSPAYPDYVAPSVCLVDGKYYMFATDVTNHNVICVLEATDVKGTWTEINRISTGAMGALWHCEVRYFNQEFIVVASTNGINGGNLMLGKFFDVMDTTVVPRETTFITPPDISGSPWTRSIYKSSLVMKSQDDIEVFVGWKGNALDANTDWRVGRVVAERLPQTLDLDASGYIEVASYTDNSTFTSTPGKSNVMDHTKYAIDATITDLTGQPSAFAQSTNETASIYVDSTSKKFFNELWGIVGGGQAKELSYGLSVGDRITMMMDNDYELFVNGRLIHKVDNIANAFDNYGKAFGDKLGKTSLSNIKVYKKDAHIYSAAKAEAYKTQLLQEYATTPDNFIWVDQFNRASLGTTSENGKTYEIVGEPIIENNALRPSGGANAVLVPASGNMSIIFSQPTSSSINARFGMYLKYTDANNYIKLTQIDAVDTPFPFYLEVKEGGVATQIDYLFHYFPNDRKGNWRFDVIDGVVQTYVDGVRMADIAIPNKAFDNKIGFTSGYAGTTYDYIIIKSLV